MKYLSTIIILTACIVLSGCPGEQDIDFARTIKNNSSERIYIFSRIEEDSLLPEHLTIDPTYKIESGDSSTTHYSSQSFKAGDKLRFMIFRQSTVNLYGWDGIREQNIYDARYDLTLEELEMQFNYTIEFP